MNTYSRQPIGFTHGNGVWLWSTEGKKYLDGLAGIAVNTLGHNHPRLVKAICEQAGQLIHTSNLYEVPLQQKLAQRLCKLSGLQEAFFCNSGAEANEAAIKLARRFGHLNGEPNAKILVMERAWHGRTIATLAATDSPKAKEGFGSLPSGFVRVPYNDWDAIQAAQSEHPEIKAILLEVLQGEGGIHVAETVYLHQIRALSNTKNWLMMIDEVQSGIARTGQWFGFQHAKIIPDVITLAKGLGSGVPIAACLAGGKAYQVLTPGSHGTTFGGGPLVCTAALATLDAIEQENLLVHALEMGDLIKKILTTRLQPIQNQITIRGIGLMLGIQLPVACAELVTLARERGYLINVTREKVVRLLPPLIINTNEASDLAETVAALILEFMQKRSSTS